MTFKKCQKLRSVINWKLLIIILFLEYLINAEYFDEVFLFIHFVKQMTVVLGFNRNFFSFYFVVS